MTEFFKKLITYVFSYTLVVFQYLEKYINVLTTGVKFLAGGLLALLALWLFQPLLYVVAILSVAYGAYLLFVK